MNDGKRCCLHLILAKRLRRTEALLRKLREGLEMLSSGSSASKHSPRFNIQHPIKLSICL